MIASPAFATCSTRTLVAAGPRARWTGADRPAVLPCRGKVRFHAPARGATRTCCPAAAIACSFNPRPRAGGDGRPHRPAGRRCVSIHAPARGGDTSLATRRTQSSRFNPRPRAGGDLADIVARHHAQNSFNPRPRAGGDTPATYPRSPSSFNPRPRAGGDAGRSWRGAPTGPFQSTPPRGGRREALPRSSAPSS